MVYSKNGIALGKDNYMISFYSGTPGSGKSFHMAKDIWFKLRMGRNIISTVNIDIDMVSKNGKKRIGDFVYIPILELNPEFFYRYAYENHSKGKEGQTTIIIDEAQIIFNPREFQRKDRADWILFFTKHRHLGYHIIMTSQFDRLIDRQVRCLFEYEVKHRKINNYGLLFLLPWTFFACIEYWYGNKLVISRRFMRFKKKTAAIYDSYVMFDDFLSEQVANINTNISATAELPEVNNKSEDVATETTTIRVKEEDEDGWEPPPVPPTPADVQLGARGPQRSGWRGWWLKWPYTLTIEGDIKAR